MKNEGIEDNARQASTQKWIVILVIVAIEAAGLLSICYWGGLLMLPTNFDTNNAASSNSGATQDATYTQRHGDQRTVDDFLSADERRCMRSPIRAENYAEAYKKRTNKGVEYVIFTRGNTGKFYNDGQKTKNVVYHQHSKWKSVPQILELPDETEWRDQQIWFTTEGQVDMARMPDRSKWKYNDN